MSGHPRPRPPYTLRTSSSSVSKPTSANSAMSSSLSQSPAHQMQQTMSSRAPLPSPTMSSTPFFPAFPVSTTHPQQQNSQVQQHDANQQQSQQQQQTQQQQRRQPAPYSQGFAAGTSNANHSAPETGSLLRDYGLVAEAARRAQMAVLMRDMEGCEL